MFLILTAPTFGPKHLLGLLYVVMIICGGLLLFGKTPSKRKTLIIIVLFYVFEILKLGYMIIQKGTFPMNHLPLHLCSMPLYVWPILYFVKKDSTLEKYALATAFVTVTGAALAALILPENIIGSNEAWFPFTGNFLPWVSFTYHGIMIMSAIYLLRSNMYVPEYKDALRVMPLTLGLMIIALIVNVILDKDFMLLHHGNGSPFQFIIDSNGQTIYTLTMIFVGLVVIGFISTVLTTIYRLIKRVT